MLKPKKKVTKRELKQDKFVLFTLKAKNYIEDNARLLARVGIGLLILIVLVSFYVRSKRSASVEASALLGEAQLAYNLGDSKRAESVLKKLIDEYEGVTPAGQGCFMLAKMYWEKDDFTNAKIYFKKYIDDYAEDDILTAAALSGYADCLVKENKIAEAAQYYEKAGHVNQDDPMTPSYLYSAAWAYMEAGQPKKAEKLAEEIIKNFEKSEYKKRAEVLLNMAKLKA